MARKLPFMVLSLLLLSGFACADDWTRTYQVGDKPTLRVDTNDAAIEVWRGSSRVISVRIVTEGVSIGPGGLHVVEHQNGDAVELQVHSPRDSGFHIGWHRRGTRVEVQTPQDTAVDLHSGDGHIRLDGTSGQARIETGDGHVEVRNFNGSLRGRTGDGHMTVDGVFTEVNLSSGDGHVEFSARPGSKMSASWYIHTSDGRVEARIPSDLGAEVYAHTGDGRITVDVPLTTSGSMERTRVRGKLNGGGPLFEIGTGDGRISISKY
jgi:hypothetical protein